jgi:hypothetical protein
MNRLIIIGNGFDLAHGKKTSFKDFILDYFCNAVDKFHDITFYKDELIELRMTDGFPQFYSKPKPIKKDEVLQTLSNIDKSKNNFVLKFHSRLISRAYSDIVNLNWVDLELLYFKVLLETKNAHQNQDENQFQEIKKINDELDFIKEKLITYLKKEEEKFDDNFDRSALISCFSEHIKSEDVVMERITSEKPDSICFLSFNYTYTLTNYITKLIKTRDTNVNYIHGDLENHHAEPIFGFGDELDKKYIEFEDENNNELFRHIKSFDYHKTKNYFDLVRYIDSKKFQVQIYGHSCGLTDRTMLNQIFEHENCISIKIFYYETDKGNDFIEKTHEISRHFKDKGLMRKKIVPFDLSRSMPQPIKT